MFNEGRRLLFQVVIVVIPDTKIEPVATKAEPVSPEEVGGGISYTEIDIDLSDVNKECLEHSERITRTAGNVSLYLF